MNKPLLVCITAAMLLLAGPSAWARIQVIPHGYLTIYESVSPGVVEVDVTHLTGVSGTPAVDQQAEFGSVTATLTGADSSSGFLVLGTRYLQLLEPGSTEVVSDVVKLVANPVAYSDGGYLQTFSIFFYSDGYADGEIDFAALVAASAGSPRLGETGDLQNVSAAELLITAPAFNLYVKSDTTEINQNPVPGTLLLVGSGLLGLIVYSCRKKQG